MSQAAPGSPTARGATPGAGPSWLPWAQVSASFCVFVVFFSFPRRPGHRPWKPHGPRPARPPLFRRVTSFNLGANPGQVPRGRRLGVAVPGTLGGAGSWPAPSNCCFSAPRGFRFLRPARSEIVTRYRLRGRPAKRICTTLSDFFFFVSRASGEIKSSRPKIQSVPPPNRSRVVGLIP